MTRHHPPLVACHECCPHVLAHRHSVAVQLGSAVCISPLSWSLQWAARMLILMVRALLCERRCLPAQRTSKPELNCKHEICMPCKFCAAQRMNDVFRCAVNISRCLPARQPTNAEELPRSPLLPQSVLRTCFNPTDFEAYSVRATHILLTTGVHNPGVST